MTLLRLPSGMPGLRRHQPGCTFGPGFFRVVYQDDAGRQVRYFDEGAAADSFASFLSGAIRVQRDACLDQPEPHQSDALTPDVVDAEAWLGLPRAQAMAELGIRTEADYHKAASAIEAAVYARDNRATQGGVRAPIVIRRKRTPGTEPFFGQGGLTRIRSIKS